MVKIDSGPVTADLFLREVPPSKWRDLVRERRMFIGTQVSYDCRCLIRFRQDADSMWRSLGYDSVDDLIRHGYEMDPDEVRLAVEWLERRSPDDVPPGFSVPPGDRIKAQIAALSPADRAALVDWVINAEMLAGPSPAPAEAVMFVTADGIRLTESDLNL